MRKQVALELFLKAAFEAGCPPEQLMNFERAGYVPQPKQLELHAASRACDEDWGPTQIGYGGARGPGKSHAVFAQLALDDCQRCSGLKGLYLRKSGKRAQEQLEDLRLKVLHSTPHEYKRSEGAIRFPNKSRIVVGHFWHEGDVDHYLGLEYDVMAIEEATSLTLVKYRALRDSNRTSRTDWRPRIYTTTNPGGVGHAWYKETFIDPWRRHEEVDARFVFGTVDDNVFVDVDYRRKLEENTGWRLRAYRWGDWDISAGQFFTTWHYDVHVVEPVTLRGHWMYWCALDYGFTHPTVCYLMAKDQDGTVYVVDEHRQTKWLVPSHAVAIREMVARNGLTLDDLEVFVAGGDVFNKSGASETTPAQQYEKNGITLTRANMDRPNGAARMLEYLGDVEAGIKPRMFIFDRCARLIDCLPAMQHNPHRPEDVLKVDIDEDGQGGDDPYDGLRYGLMELDRLVAQGVRTY